ncbi:MAG: sugar phosphate isomerase/epimerase [Ignavibacteria bacterium]|nr:sugar phosphate isomerase/epimerase [Ignavibacteria bacterium]
MHRLSLAFVSDEISADFREAARYGTQWGISTYELRMLKTGRVPDVQADELENIMAAVKEYGIKISALSPGIFKHPLSQQSLLNDELTDVLPRTMAMAKEFEAPLVIVFGFQRERDEPAENFEKAVGWMRRAAELAAQNNIVLAVENEPGFWCDSGANTAKMISAVNSRALRANWDPCNGYGTKEVPFPDGYQAIKKFIANVHVKDTKEGSLVQCVPVGEGAIDWKGQLEALMCDRIVNHVSIETHCLPLIEKSQQNVATLTRYLNEIQSRLEA